ncbi:MAG: F0F1 ATP synthase subunit B [Candidatus Beckwithbacteria bacterium]|nr:F0F1 ATP synthase subunit B [Candidatus Beckwithbacteria bacterium]
MEIQWYQLLFQIINFGILIFILNKFLYKPVITIINQRNKKIEDSIKAAENNLKEKSKIAEIKKQAVEESEKEAVKIVEAAKKEAAKTGRQILDNARQEAETEVDKKLLLLTQKLADEEARITGHVTDLVVEAAAKVLKGSLNQREQREVIDNEIKKIAKLK